MFKQLFNYLAKPTPLTILNMICICSLICGNSHWQVLCNPTEWAIVSLAITFISTISYPILNNNFKVTQKVLAFTNGISAITYLYFIIFLAHMNIWGLMFIIIGIGFLTFIPHFLFIQIIRNYTWKQQNHQLRNLFLSGVISSTLFIISSSIYYHIEANKLEEIVNGNSTNIEPSFAHEKILGMHFIYHTKFCEWDGWRPPMHEPTLIFWLWTGGNDFLTRDLDKRIELYHAFFPNNKIKKSCSCAHEYKNWYRSDSLWIKHPAK